jgi:mannose-6-phosphate isomerase-like protein (cupin superfamily)
MEIKQTVGDHRALEAILAHGVTPSKLQYFDFRETVVAKPWGYEYLALEAEDSSICAWVLHMKNNGTGTSLHCHHHKKTFIHVLSGSIWVDTLTKHFTLKAGESMWIDAATFHAMGALVNDTILTEIESPSYKPDAIRYKDKWGREYQEYESQCELIDVHKMYCPYKTYYRLQMQLYKLMETARSKWGLE